MVAVISLIWSRAKPMIGAYESDQVLVSTRLNRINIKASRIGQKEPGCLLDWLVL